MKKRGFMEISFGMIFSIILIIVFLAFAFFGIKKLLEVQESAMISQFEKNLQDNIDTMWKGPQGQRKKRLGYRVARVRWVRGASVRPLAVGRSFLLC